MRIWYLPFDELDNQRVLGQHAEVHAIYRLVFNRGTSWKEWAEPKHRRDFFWIHNRIVAEMAERGSETLMGINAVERKREYERAHATWPEQEFTEQWLDSTGIQRPVKVSDEVIEAERWQLVNRWGGNFRGRVWKPEYEALLDRYHENGGCTHKLESGTEWLEDYGLRDDGAHKYLCLLCKRFIKIVDEPLEYWVEKERANEVRLIKP